MKCTKCETEVCAPSKICKNCGQKMDTENIVECAFCNEFFEKILEICPFCGTEFFDNFIENTNSDEDENAFALCPQCKLSYDIKNGYCAFCGYKYPQENQE